MKLVQFPRRHKGPSPAEVAENFCPARLKQARHLAMLGRPELGERSGITAARLQYFEASVTKPRADELEKLAEVLDVPVPFFGAGRPMALLDTSDVWICGSFPVRFVSGPP